MKDTDQISHRFFGVRASAMDDNQRKIRGTGHVCLVLKPSVRNRKLFRAAVSFKSPADKLNRELGVRIAAGRLASARPGRSFVIRASNLENAFQTALESIFTKQRKVFRRGKTVMRPFVPDWLHQAVVERERQMIPLKG